MVRATSAVEEPYRPPSDHTAISAGIARSGRTAAGRLNGAEEASAPDRRGEDSAISSTPTAWAAKIASRPGRPADGSGIDQQPGPSAPVACR